MNLTTPAATVRGPAATFTSDVYVTPVQGQQDGSRLIAALVRFTPGARSNWHSHASGQALHVTEGVGLVSTRDGRVIRMRAGDTVWTPPGEEHWHGAGVDCFMTHLALLDGVEGGDGTVWLEPVTDEQYAAANQQP